MAIIHWFTPIAAECLVSGTDGEGRHY